MDIIKNQYKLYKKQSRIERGENQPAEPVPGSFLIVGEIPCGWTIVKFSPSVSTENSKLLDEELVISSRGQSMWKMKGKYKYMVKNWVGSEGIYINDSIDQQIARMKTCIEDMPSELRAWQNRSIIEPESQIQENVDVPDTTKIPNIRKYMITSVHGTPGSGKSTLIVNMLKRLSSDYKILIVAPSHNVVNNFGHKIDQMTPKPNFTILSEESRLDPSLIARHVSNHKDFNPSKKNALIESVQITISTVTKNIKNVRRAQIDIVICDEAGRVPVIDFMTLIQKMSNIKAVILAGDPRQLPARIGDAETEDILRFVSSRKIGPVFNLSKQYRFGEQANNMIAKAYYNGKMTAARKERESKIYCIEISSCECDSEEIIGCKKEAEIINEIWSNAANIRNSDVLVLTPYKTQYEILESRFIDKEIQIKTIDTCQGDEAQNVFISLGRHRGQGFINKQRMNVALSRAKGHTFIVGHELALEKCDALKAVLREIKKVHQYFRIS